MEQQIETQPKKITTHDITLYVCKFIKENGIDWKLIPDSAKRKIMTAKYSLELAYHMNALLEGRK